MVVDQGGELPVVRKTYVVERILVIEQGLCVRGRPVERPFGVRQYSLHVVDDGRLVVGFVAGVGGESETGGFEGCADGFPLTGAEAVHGGWQHCVAVEDCGGGRLWW